MDKTESVRAYPVLFRIFELMNELCQRNISTEI